MFEIVDPHYENMIMKAWSITTNVIVNFLNMLSGYTKKIVVALLTRKNNMEHSALFALPKVVKIRNRLKMLCCTTSGVVVLVCCSS